MSLVCKITSFPSLEALTSSLGCESVDYPSAPSLPSSTIQWSGGTTSTFLYLFKARGILYPENPFHPIHRTVTSHQIQLADKIHMLISHTSHTPLPGRKNYHIQLLWNNLMAL